MAPTIDKRGSNNTASQDAFSGAFLSNLAPLVSLFGEQVSKQFLSQANGIPDCILFATCPVGLLTAVVSVIRLAGSKILRTFIGRARENRAAVAKELLNSTSLNICELWSGDGIVRVSGRPFIKQFIYKPFVWDDPSRVLENDDFSRVFCLSDAFSFGIYKPVNSLGDVSTAVDLRRSRESVKAIMNQNPNLTLGRGSHPFLTWCLATTGILLQIVVILSTGIITLHFKKYKSNGLFTPELGYYIFTSGVILIVLGLIVGCYIIQCSSEETDFVPKKSAHSRDFKVITIQKTSAVGDELFGSYAIDPKTDVFRTSRLKPDPRMEKHQWQVHLVAASTVLGFILQFVGLISLHWSASVILVATSILMLGVRLLACQRLAAPLSIVKIPEGHEVAYLTMNEVVGLERWEIKCGRVLRGHQKSTLTTFDLDHVTPNIAVGVQVEAQRLVSEPDPLRLVDPLSLPSSWPDENAILVNQLADAIQTVCKNLIVSEEIEFRESQNIRMGFSWLNDILVKPKSEARMREGKFELSVIVTRDLGCYILKDRLSAIFSLWRYSLLQSIQESEDYYRILGYIQNDTALGRVENTIMRWRQGALWYCPLLGDGVSLDTCAGRPQFLRTPVFGLSLLSQVFVLVQNEKMYLRLMNSSFNAPNLERSAEDNNTQGSAFGSDHGYYTLETEMTKDLFLNFLVEIVGQIQNLRGRTYESMGLWRNTVLDSLMDTLIATGLVENRWEAGELIIPAFLKAGLLPTRLSPVPGQATFGEDDILENIT